jgi:hypothetical protein
MQIDKLAEEGGDTLPSTVKRLMMKLFDDHIECQYNLEKKSDKKPLIFKESELFDVVISKYSLLFVFY